MVFSSIFFFDFTQAVINRYTRIWNNESENTGEVSERRRIISQEEVFNKKYGWFNYVMLAADNKFNEVPKVLDRNFHEFLTYIEYIKDFNDVEEEKIQQVKNTRKK